MVRKKKRSAAFNTAPRRETSASDDARAAVAAAITMASSPANLLPRGLAAGSPAGRANLLYRDIHAPTDLLPKLGAAIADLSPSRRDVILLTANYQQYDLAINLIAELAAHGLHNYLLLCDNAALVDHAKNLGAVAAAWSSMLDRFARSPDPTCSCFGAMPEAGPRCRRNATNLRSGTYCNRSLRNRPGSCTPSVSALHAATQSAGCG